MSKEKPTPQEKFHAKYKKRFVVDCFQNTESDIIDKLESADNKSRYIKDLIRADILANKSDK